MKATELTTKLQALIAAHGDKPVIMVIESPAMPHAKDAYVCGGIAHDVLLSANSKNYVIRGVN